MGLTGKKYGVSVSFCHKLTFVLVKQKTKLLIFSQNLNFFNICKNLHTNNYV
jgi:hypothetical protein